MGSEYDPLFEPAAVEVADDLDAVRDRFARAARPFLRSSWTWLGWAFLAPAAALATEPAAERFGPPGVLLLWSLTILAGGAVEAAAILRGRGREPKSPLSRWVLHVQGNTSLVAVALSALLLWVDAAWALPGVWLLMLGQSFYLLGGLALPAFRGCGLLYQGAGLLALWPGAPALEVLAAALGIGNLWLAWAVRRNQRSRTRR